MRRSALLAAVLSLAVTTGVRAQTSSAPSDIGPYLVIETSPDVLSVLATGSRSRTGDSATLTWILLKNPPAANGAARTDIGVVVHCGRKAMQQRSFALRALDGSLMKTGQHPGPEWMPLGGGRVDHAILALACEGTATGPTGADLARIDAEWRAAGPGAAP